jgi:hypothetical protein
MLPCIPPFFMVVGSLYPLKEIPMSAPVQQQEIRDAMDRCENTYAWSVLNRLLQERDYLEKNRWVWVPYEPTDEMLDVYPFNERVLMSDAMDITDLKNIWQEMIFARPVIGVEE